MPVPEGKTCPPAVKACVQNLTDAGAEMDEGMMYGVCWLHQNDGTLRDDGHWGKDQAAELAEVASLARIVSDLPDGDQPMPGWWDRLELRGSSIYARMAGLSRRLAKLVRTRFPRRSMELKRKSADDPWELAGGVVLGAREPAIPLKDLDPDDTGETIEDVEILRVGKWRAETGDVALSEDDLRRTFELWVSKGKPRIPITAVGGHDKEPAVRLSAGADGSQVMRLNIATATEAGKECDMDEKLIQELQAKLAASDARIASLESAAKTAQTETAAEKAARLEAEKRVGALNARLAQADVARAVDAIMAPVDQRALPPAIKEPLLKVALALNPDTATTVQLAAGESPLSLLTAVLEQIRKAGVVQLSASTPAAGADTSEKDSALRAEFAEVQKAGSTLTFEAYKAGKEAK